MRITRLKIKNFRHIKNQNIEFGEKLTVITGQNSTGKSSLLGWIAQSCDFKSSMKAINGGKFKSKYSEIFRFCKENDFSKEYEVSLVYKKTDDPVEKVKIMKTRYVPKTEKGLERYRVDFDKRGVAINFPVIYLGLKRLIPLVTEKSVDKKENILKNDEKKLFSKLSKEILILLDRTISTERIKSTNKDILAMKTDQYGHLGNSAGQDNIGQIISSLLSFQRLKHEQGNKYEGGLLLIDEIDTTLYAGSQIQLIKNLYKWARDKKIQVIFTTHSLEILDYLSEHVGDDTKINFLELRDGEIKNKLNPSIKFLKNKIKTQIGHTDKIKKIEVICEDDVTEFWCKNLLNGTDFKKYLNIKKGPFGEGELSTMAESKHPIFKEMFFVLDGDCRKKYKEKLAPKRTAFLPGTTPPEVIFYNFLNSLSDEDVFWVETDDINFSKQTCFQNFFTSDLSTAKRWLKNSEFALFFGRSYSKLLNRWKQDNLELVKEFQSSLKKFIEK
ncbi:AAA family ATPase [Candidatus Parcubacteria bacterium]|nr:AAA family ATPase [Candidatus Parcubacteria bacterium]